MANKSQVKNKKRMGSLKSNNLLRDAFKPQLTEIKRTISCGLNPNDDPKAILDKWFGVYRGLKDKIYEEFYKIYTDEPEVLIKGGIVRMYEAEKDGKFKPLRIKPVLSIALRCKICKKEFIIYEFQPFGRKSYYCLGCKNLKHLPFYKIKKPNLETGEVNIDFNIRALQKLVTERKLRSKINRSLTDNLNTSFPLQEGVWADALGDIASFLSKIRDVKIENIGKIKRNKETLNKLDSKEFKEWKNEFMKMGGNNQDEIIIYNVRVGDFNKELNIFNQQNKRWNIYDEKNSIPFLEKLTNLPEFPGKKAKTRKDVDKERNDNITKLEGLANNQDFVKLGNEKMVEIIKATAKKYKRGYIGRLLYWYIENNGKISIAEFIRKLDLRINKLKKHYQRKPWETAGVSSYVNLLNFKANLFYYLPFKDEARRQKLVNIYAKSKGLFFIEKKERDILSISGFGWSHSGKPLKNAAIAKIRDDNKDKFFLCFAPSSKAFLKEGNLQFFKQTGGGKKKASKTKNIVFKQGGFDENFEGALKLELLFGKSGQGRKYFYHKDWGLINLISQFSSAKIIKTKNKKNKDIYLCNLSIKRPGIGYPEKLDWDKFKFIVGVDRGEKVPAAAVVIDRKGIIIEKELFGEDYIKAVKKYDGIKSYYQEKGFRMSKNLRGKISNLKETLVKGICSKIIALAAKYKAGIALEKLDGFRGREKKIIPIKTYKDIEDYLILNLELAGLASMRNKGKWNNGLLKMIPAFYTSVTCPKCSVEWSERRIYNPTIDKFPMNIKNKGKNIEIFGEKSNGQKIEGQSIELSRTIIVGFGKNAEEINLVDKLKEILSGSSFKKDEIKKWLKIALNPRPKQEIFHCKLCGYKENADINGAHNIALRALKKGSTKIGKSKGGIDIPF